MLEEINLKKEWNNVLKYWSKDNKDVRMERFKKFYNNFEGPEIQEFISVSDTVYKEWDYWKTNNGYDSEFTKSKSFNEAWKEFKDYWQYDTPQSQVMFEEMKIMSNNMLREWRIEYTNEEYHMKSKSEMWEEFKIKWEIDLENYNEDYYKEMKSYVHEMLRDNNNYYKEYPRNFSDFRENANYHSYDSYSLLEQYEIAQEWDTYRDYRESDSEDSE